MDGRFMARGFIGISLLRRIGILAFIAATTATDAQIIQTEESTYSAADGLAENKISAAITDRNGLYWFTTGQELNRFDGDRFQNFPLLLDKKILTPNLAFRIARTPENEILLQYNLFGLGDVGLFDPERNRFRNMPVYTALPKDYDPISFTQDAYRNIYVYALDKQRNPFLYYWNTFGHSKKLLELPRYWWDMISAGDPNFVHYSGIQDGFIWIKDREPGILRISIGDLAEKRFPKYWDGREFKPFPKGSNFLFLIAPDRQVWSLNSFDGNLFRYDCFGEFWMLEQSGLKNFIPLPFDPQGNLAFHRMKPNTVFIDSILVYHPAGRRLIPRKLPEGKYSGMYSQDYLHTLFLFGNEGLWHCRYKENKVRHHLTFNSRFKDLMGIGLIPMRGIVEGRQKEMYAVSQNMGFYRIDPESGKEELLDVVEEGTGKFVTISYDYTNLLQDARGHIWSTAPHALIRTDPQRKTARLFPQSFNPVDLVFDDPDHVFVLGLLANFNLSLFRFSLLDGSIQTIADTNDIKQWKELISFCLYKSRDGVLWVGTLKGLFGFDPKSRKLLHSPLLDTELSKYQISCITEAEDGSLWIGTMGSGLFHYDHQAGRLNQYTTMEGLPNNKIAGVLIDGKNLWVSTYHGLAYFFHDRKSFVRFYKNDGLTHSEFNRRSSCKSSDGRFWFGSLDGINSFTTQDLFYNMMRQESKVLPVEISYSKNRKQSVEHFRFSELKSLHIPANRRYCSFRFAMSGYHSDILPQIAYRVEGIDHEWNYTDGNQFSISWLPSGRHTLKVKGADQAGNWSEEYHILLDVQEYFYKSWWFIGLLFALASGAFWQFNRLRLRRHLEQLESNRLRELNEVKSKLYAYITHEFRTPLTLILGYASYGIENDSKESPHFQKIKSAGKRLLQLVNQILDLSKIESGSIEVRMIQDDLVFYLKELFEHFRELAERKNIQYRFDTSVSELQMDYDKDLVMKIISNLLSNAIKFTPEGGRVEMRLLYPITDAKDPEQTNQVEILIRDTGPGLTEEQQQKIFDRFYQVSAQDALQGTGIGLALVKELTQLLDGQVKVSSSPGKGSEFSLRFKRMQKAKPTSIHTSDPVPDWVTGNIRESGQMEDMNLSDSQTTGKKGVLIVEDNPEVAGFIMQGLGDHYQTRWAEHGKIGLEMARDWVPDLILSDVMMPEMDGLSLLEQLKADPVTSHIPVVLLTSLAEVEHKIAGLKRGANAYLAKPFEAEELRLTLNNLIRLSDQIRMRYSQAVDSRNFELPAIPEPESPAAPADHKAEPSQKLPVQLDLELEDAFFKKLVQYIEAHLMESEMDIQDLCRAVGMSQSQLNRKINALTGVSSVKLVRAVRLSHACKLLKTRKDLQVSEIAYETGFTSPAYFTRVFTQEFGTAPSEWREQ